MNSLCHRYLNQNILPFVGRERELRRLRNLFREFLDEGESKYVLIAAESGIGKTRLVREFEERLAEEFGETCVIVHARYLESNVAVLTPILNGFEACLNQQPNLRPYLQKAGFFSSDQGEGSGSESIEPREAPRNLASRSEQDDRSPSKHRPSSNDRSTSEAMFAPPPLQVLLDSFSEIAKRFPLVLILEDVHNMDDFPVFDQFFLGLSSASKFVLVTERRSAAPQRLTDQPEKSDPSENPSSAAPPLRSSEHLIREIALREERTSDIIELLDFGAAETRQCFTILFDLEPDPQLIETVQTRTRGRPLSLRTMIRQLVTMGALVYEEGQWLEDPTAVPDAAVSDTGEQEMLARFQREVERLNPSEQAVAMHAALLGEQFDVRLLRSLIRHRTSSAKLGTEDFSDELFQRSVDLLTFKSIIRRATPSISFSTDSSSQEAMGPWCYEFSHAHFWNTVLESARNAVAQEHDLVLTIVGIAGRERLPLYSSAFLSIMALPFALTKVSVERSSHDPSSELLGEVEHFLLWCSQVVRSIWSREPQECLRLLLGIRPFRDEITWRFASPAMPDLSEAAMGALLDLHTLLVEAYQRNGSSIEAEHDLEFAAVLDKFIRASSLYSPEFKGISHGRVAMLRAILCAGRTSYSEFERWALEARTALEAVRTDPAHRSDSRQKTGHPEPNREQRLALERAYLLTVLTRAKGEALLNAGRFKDADALIEEGMPTAKLLADRIADDARFDEYSLYYRLAVNSKLKQDQSEQASELTRQIMALAKEHGNTLVETMFLVQAALAAFSSGDVKGATAYCDLGIANGRRYGIRFVEIMSYLWRMIIAGVHQDAEKVKECSLQLASLVEDARVVAQSPNLLQRISLIEGRATAMNFLGRYHAALEFSDEAIRLAASHQHDSFAAWAQNEKALALIGLGRFEESLAVAKASVELAGEQRLAERTARTALIMAYAGMGQFEEARREAEHVRAEYKERNPYYLRFALAESRLLRLLAGRAQTLAERQVLRGRLQMQAAAMVELAQSWDAPLLEEQLQKEFEEILPKRNELERARMATPGAREPAHDFEKQQPTIQLFSFGSLDVERIVPLSGWERSSTPRENGKDGITGQPGMSDHPSSGRDNKVRQLISLLVLARAESLDSRIGRGAAREGTKKGVSREHLIDLLWPDSDASNANALYSTIKRARAFLGNPEALLLNEEGYFLGPIVQVDCEEAIRHYDEARQARKRNALFSITFHYEQIIKLTDRGPFMSGNYGAWLDGLRTRLATLRRTAAVQLIEIELERGLLERAEEMCFKLLAQDEFDEEALRGLLLINAKRRQTTNVVRLFDNYTKKLKAELRAEPSKELRSLYSSLVPHTD